MSENVVDTVRSEDGSEAPEREYRALPKKLRWHSWFQWQIYNQMSLSYDRAYVNGWTAGALPALKYLYKDRPEDLKEALLRTRDYWLCEQTFGTLIFGIYLSMEEKYANGADFDPSMIRSVKTSLMGPISGIGDSIMGSTIRQILLLIFLGFSLEGNAWAPPVFFCLYTFGVTVPLFAFFLNKGYELGSDAVTKILGTPWLKAITKAAGLAAMMMMGAMTCKYTSFALNWAYDYQGIQVDLQSQLDAAVPGIFVLAATFIYYWMVGKKIHYLWLILGTLAVCAALVFLGIV